MSQSPQPPARDPHAAPAAPPAPPGAAGPHPSWSGHTAYGWAPPGVPLPPAWAQPWPAPVVGSRSTAKAPLVIAVVALGALIVGGVAGFLIATAAFMSVTGGMGMGMGVGTGGGMEEEPLTPTEQFPAVPPGDLGPDPTLDEYADACFAGDLQACDDLLYESPPLSEYERYGGTCGGRVKPYDVAACTDLE